MERIEACLFCSLPSSVWCGQNELAYVYPDAFPVVVGHRLIIPKRHVVDFFELEPAEVLAVHALLVEQKQLLQKQDEAITGFNIGMNCGSSAGQTLFHCHVHLIPRRAGDVADPKGGVRHVIPGKGYYGGG